MTTQASKTSRGFTAKEIRGLQTYAAICLIVAVGMFFVAPAGIGQVLGVAFGVALIPVAPLVVYLSRRRKAV